MKLRDLRRDVTSDWALCALVTTLSLTYLALFVFVSPYDFADEGYHAYVSERISAGDRPYLDLAIESYSPLLFSFLAIANGSFIASRLLAALGSALAVGLAFLCLRAFASRRVAFWVAFTLAVVPGPFCKFYVRLLQLALLLAALWWCRHRSQRSWLALSVVVVLGALLRVDVLYTGIVIAALLLVLERRARFARALTVLGALACALLVAALGLRDREVFVTYLGRLAGVVGIATKRARSDQSLPLPALASLWRFDSDAANAWMLVGALLCTLALLVRIARGRRDNAALVVGAWVLFNTPQYLLVRPDAYHVMQQAFAYFVAAVCAAYGGRRSILAVLGVAALAWGATLSHTNAQRWTLGVLARRVEWQNPCGVDYVSYDGDGSAELLTAICRISAPTDTLETMPFLPGYNHLARRRRPTPHLYVLAENFASAEAQKDYVGQATRAAPALALYGIDDAMNAQVNGLLVAYAPMIHHHYWQRYVPVTTQRGRMLLMSPAPANRMNRSGAGVVRARALFAAGDFVGGVVACANAWREAPDDSTPLQLLAQQASARHDEATAARLWELLFDGIKRTLVTAPERRGQLQPLLAESGMRLSEGLIRQQHGERAESVLRELSLLVPDDASVALYFAQVLRQRHGCAAAQPELARALGLAPGSAIVRREASSCGL